MFDKIKNLYKQSRRMQVFCKAFSITVFFCAAVVIGAVIAWNVVVTPPMQLGVIAAPSDGANRHEVDGDGFLVVPPTNNAEDDENEGSLFPVYNAPYWAEDRREYFWTFLIIGLNEGVNANTVMVASYCGITREANLISIPRDVPVHPTRNGRRLASSYIVGSNRGGGVAGGVAQVQRDVQTVIGFIPDFYILIDYDAFFTIIDTVGGIEIYVSQRMRYDDPYQNLRIDIQPGLQHMDSQTALHFVRFRQANRNSGYSGLPGGDLDRARNQQAVIEAVIGRLLRPENLNPVRINEFINIFNDSVHTNISLTDMLYFANELNHVRRGADGLTEALNTYVFPTHSGSRNGVSYQLLTPASVVELVNRTINPFAGDREISANDLQIVRQ